MKSLFRISPIWIFLLLLTLTLKGFGQQYLRGKVLDAISHQPIEAASVYAINAPEKITNTNQFGEFQLDASLNARELKISLVGYETSQVTVPPDMPISILLQRANVSLKDVVLQSNQPIAFSTLARIDLAIKPVKNAQELLRLVPGLFVAQHAGGGKAEQLFLRGFDADHGTDVAVSVDGMPVNMVSHAHGQGYADAHFIIPETIASIDFGAGPYYPGQGNLNTAGYVAFSTLQHVSENRLQVETGRYQTNRLLGMFNLLQKGKEKQNAYLAAEFNYSNGPTLDKQQFNRVNIFGKYNLILNERTRLVTTLSAFKSGWNASGQVPDRAVESGLIDRFGSIDPSEGGNTARYNFTMKLTHRLSNQSTWESQAYYSRYLFDLYSNFTFFLKDSINGDAINQAEKRNLMGFQTTFNTKQYLNNLTLQSTYGAGIRYDAIDQSQLANTVKREFTGNVKLGDIHESNAYAYVQQQLSAGKWFFNAGIRYDYLHFAYQDHLSPIQLPQQGKGIFSPKLNIQYALGKNFQVYVKAGKGFHSNDTRVVVANMGREILPAAYGADIGVILKPAPNLIVNLAAWYLNLEQEFVYVGDDGNVEPSGKSRREGLDILVKYQMGKHLFANVNLNLTKARTLGEAKGLDYIPLAPLASSTGGIFYKAKYGFNGSLTYRYLQNRPANTDNSIVARGYLLADASVNFSRPRFEVGIAIENLFNTSWNEAQFATTSRLRNESTPATELNFTPGTPFFPRLKFALYF